MRCSSLLSRFALTSEQALRWFDPKERAKGTAAKVTDEEILANPYRMSEVDLGDWNDSPVSVGTIDRGLLPDATIAAKHPVPAPSKVGSPNDARRLRAALVAVLREASENGDALLSVPEALQRVGSLDLRTRVSSARTGQARTARRSLASSSSSTSPLRRARRQRRSSSPS